ncbi:hypothetical protein M413DRAFT_260480 [Hebeloma cylindrosporum]|uniref:Uncharacterized protein n=1 Tax=Hebeloma cylindrosporum TaxID=76867 RepID=A0A0C3CD21_HEBCY|nr:hypothetical protein M413DRAFT_260480 [Hebeloma cylindrosporum h7]
MPRSFHLRSEEHAEAYAYWAKHRARAAALDEAFPLDEFSYVAGDKDKAHFVSAAGKPTKEWEAKGDTDEQRKVKVVLCVYRDTL